MDSNPNLPRMLSGIQAAPASQDHSKLIPIKIPGGGAAMEPLGLLKALRRRWGLALLVGTIAATFATAAAHNVVVPAQYEAEALLRVTPYSRVLLTPNEPQPDNKSYMTMQVGQLKRQTVLKSALMQPEVAKLAIVKGQSDPVNWLRMQLRIGYVGGELLRISMSGEHPEELPLILNAVTGAYLREVVDAEVKGRSERRDMLKALWEKYQEQMKETRDTIKSLTLQTGADDRSSIAILNQARLDRLGRAQEEIARNQAELQKLQVELKVVERRIVEDRAGMATRPLKQTVIEDLINRDPRVIELQKFISQAGKALGKNTRVVRSQDDPSLVHLQHEIRSAEAELAERRKTLEFQFADQRVAAQGGGQGGRTDLLREKIEILSELVDFQREQIKGLDGEHKSVTEASANLFAMQDEMAHVDSITKKLGNEVETLKLELLAPAKVQLQEPATTPLTKDETKKIKATGIAGVGAFALALMGVSLWEFRARRVDSTWEIAQGLGIRVVGTLPMLPKGGLPGRLKRARDRGEIWQSLLIESIDMTCASLLHASRTGSLQVVMVASAVGGEGKTSLSSHLASSLARAGRKTLLIDGDLRRPSAHRLFDLVSLTPGLCEVLRGDAETADAIHPLQAGSLSIMTAGECDGGALRGLYDGSLHRILDQLRREFDFIVIDSSPVLPVADAMPIAQSVDGVLFSIMRHVSCMPKVHAAYERLRLLDVPMLGAVMTGAGGDIYQAGYHYAHSPSLASSMAERAGT